MCEKLLDSFATCETVIMKCRFFSFSFGCFFHPLANATTNLNSDRASGQFTLLLLVVHVQSRLATCLTIRLLKHALSGASFIVCTLYLFKDKVAYVDFVPRWKLKQLRAIGSITIRIIAISRIYYYILDSVPKYNNLLTQLNCPDSH